MHNGHSNLTIYSKGFIFGGCGWERPTWHEAVSVRSGIIDKVGAYKELSNSNPEAEVIDLGGATLLPGLCDAHLHLAVGGRSLLHVDLAGLNPSEIRHELSRAIREEPSQSLIWFKARNWESWLGQIDASFLDDIIPERPAVVFGRDLHSCCCNSKALMVAGITASTPEPECGVIDRTPDGKPTGILKEEAMKLLLDVLSKPTQEEWRRYILTAQQHLIALGLTAVSEVMEAETEPLYFDLARNGELILQIDGWRRWDEAEVTAKPPLDEERLKINTLKVFLDGAYGSKTAALSRPYVDDPDNNGLLFYDDAELIEKLGQAVRLGWRLALHAIGDRAVSQACRILKNMDRLPTAPHRIEHLQTIDEPARLELPASGAVASIQPVHYLDDVPWLADRIDRETRRGTFVWKSLFDAGVPFAIGTDWPVASADPLRNLQAAINRVDFGDSPQHDFDVTEAFPPHIAIRAATYGWALAAGVESGRGCIKPGQAADFTVVSGVNEKLESWEEAKVTGTVIEGKYFEVQPSEEG